jgi:hypothetical protein
VNIGFNFPFYENTYSQLYFSTNGLVTFGEGSREYWNQSIPDTNAPDNFIAPLWGDLCVDCSGYNSGQVYYYLGGSAPNRYFVVEWFEVSELGENDLLTFEVILHEDGDIVLQYLSLGSSPWATIGIEDDAGIDGLEYNFGAWGSLSNLAVQFYRSGAIARVKAWPAYQSTFSGAGGGVTYPMHIRNTGEVGDDTYDLFVTTGWTVELYEADGTTLLFKIISGCQQEHVVHLPYSGTGPICAGIHLSGRSGDAHVPDADRSTGRYKNHARWNRRR